MIDWSQVKLTEDQIKICKQKAPEINWDYHWADYIYKQFHIRQILPGEFPFGE